MLHLHTSVLVLTTEPEDGHFLKSHLACFTISGLFFLYNEENVDHVPRLLKNIMWNMEQGLER